nr:uncharacterized protein LOC113816133 [Penaeus vannamei]
MCRRINKICESQCMGQLPNERLNPAPPFYFTSLDLFGPYLVKDTVKKRTTLKVYGIIFACMTSRAVHIDIAEGYSTDNFLNVFRRFISIRGFPKMVYSDRGSQLVKANKELTQAVGNLNFDKIMKFGRKEGMTWKFTKGADAPWQNGRTESLIRLVKRGISISIGNKVLSYADLQTVMFEIANLINQRPIGIKPGSDLDLGSYLCPNDLLLGRASPIVPSGVFEDNCFDGKVRNVTLRYKLSIPGTKYNGQRDILIDRSVHNIVVILPIEEQMCFDFSEVSSIFGILEVQEDIL